MVARDATARGSERGAGEQGTISRSIQVLGYDVLVAPWLLEQVGRRAATVAPAHTMAIITDEQVGPTLAPTVIGSLHHHLPGVRVILRAIAAGERHKTRDTWSALTDWLLEERCGRDTTILALGGGVVGDVAGFVAATFMRGIPFVQLPTSLLAMVDASVGGKVGVDTPAGKNLVGAFHQPREVLIDPTVLQTLAREHRRAGMAEVLKHGIIADELYLAQAVAVGPAVVEGGADVEWNGAAITALIARSVEIKASVVRQDEQEGGIRQILNFGHTIGHAIEAASGFSLLHGEAIAIGMVLEAKVAERIGVADEGTSEAVAAAIRALDLPTDRPLDQSPQSLMDLMASDKKVRAGRLRLALPARIGQMAGAESGYGIAVHADDVRSVLESAP